MSDVRGPHIGLPERVHEFVVACTTDELTDDLRTAFEQLLRESDDACRLYLQCVDISVALPSILSAIPDEESPYDISFLTRSPNTLPSAPAAPGGMWHGTAAYFSGWPVAYLIATVVLGIGLLIGAFTYVSQPGQIATHSRPPAAEQQLAPESLPASVGRITGMADCRWKKWSVVSGQWSVNQQSGIRSQESLFALGDKFAISSGMMEITYDTGAKVILQGPVSYETASNGGYLSVGKLTGKLEKKILPSPGTNRRLVGSGAGGEGGLSGGRIQHFSSNPQSPISNPFVIRTPMATITDLGTEFGVEVDRNGQTTSHVFRGSVELRTTSSDKTEKPIVRVLHANESARVERIGGRDGGNRRIVLLPPAEPIDFVRELSNQPSKSLDRFELIAWWQFDGKDFLADSSGHGHALINHGAAQVDGAASFNGSAIMSTVDSIDLTPYKRVRVSWSQKAPPPNVNTNQIVWEHTGDYNFASGAFATSRTAAGGLAMIRGATQNRYNMDRYPIVADTWENFTVEINLANDQRDRHWWGVVKVLNEYGTLIGDNTRWNAVAPDSFVDAAFHIGGRAKPSVYDPDNHGFVGLIDNLKIEGTLRSSRNVLKSNGTKKP